MRAGGGRTNDGELGALDLLTMEHIRNGFNGAALVCDPIVRERILELELHSGAFMRLKAADEFEPVLLENGDEISLGDVVSERGVANDDLSLADWCEFLVPLGDTGG